MTTRQVFEEPGESKDSRPVLQTRRMGRPSGSVNNSTMTYRERRLAKAQRLREWAQKREQKSGQAYEAAHAIIDKIPAGQPILVGHHSEHRHRRELARHDSLMSHGIEHTQKAEEMRSRADDIEAAADNAIYSDDPDAIERLEDKLAGLEAERDGIKAYNKSARSGSPDRSLLTNKWQRELDSYLKFASGTQIPSFALSNLNGNINRTRKRIELLKRRASRSLVKE